MGDKVTFDECVELKHSPDCDPHKLWLQVAIVCVLGYLICSHG